MANGNDRDLKVLWVTILLLACYLLWRRRQRSTVPSPLDPLAKDEDGYVPNPFLEAIDLTTGTDVTVYTRRDKQGVYEVIKTPQGEERARRRAAEIYDPLREEFRKLFEQFHAKRLAAMTALDEQFAAEELVEREEMIKRYQGMPFYNQLSRAEIERLIDGDPMIKEKVLQFRETSNGKRRESPSTGRGDAG